MPQTAPCLLSLDPNLLATPDGPARLARTAGEFGIDGLIWWRDAPLADAEPLLPPALSGLDGPPFYLAVDLSRFPLDHPLVAQHPDAFAIRRGPAAGEATVDPRKPLAAVGEARARLRSAEAWGLLRGAIEDRLHAAAEAGLAGLRLIHAERIAPAFLAELTGGPRRAGTPLKLMIDIAEVGREGAKALALAEPDALISSFAWWDGRSPWLIEEYDELGGIAPLLAEIGREPGGGDESGRALAAAGLSDGLILPAAMLLSGEAAIARVRSAIDLVRRLQAYRGAMRRLSGSGAALTAILRLDTPDPRDAAKALLILFNPGPEDRPLPDLPRLLASAGLDLTGFTPIDGEGGETLAPGEARLFTAERRQPILLPVAEDDAGAAEAAAAPRLVIDDIGPCVEGGPFPVKRVVGELVTVEANVFADGHEQLAAELLWRPADEAEWRRVRMTPLINDRWRATLPLERMGRHLFTIEGWLDRFGGFRRDFAKKREAAVAQPVDHAEGRRLVEAAATRSEGERKAALEAHLRRIDEAADADASAAALLNEELAALMQAADDRPHRLRSEPRPLDAERLQARYSSWYELFPRSMSGTAERHGDFDDVIAHLPRIRAMGFDTLYFPPIHPIGRTNRKGRNNTLDPGPDDVGSPYAIGSEEGGHDAIHPQLGSFEDFGRLVAAARDHGLEIALDFAIQCSPDHPWLKEHPGWFDWRPDGTIKYAENPPKKYQDIVNVDFYKPEATPDLWLALRDVVLLWIEMGVKTFRVDNPHTKPLPFWEWMIGEVRALHPDAIFLAEAFTRPTMMYRLGKIGFSQSYTYFTWRNSKQELTEYFVELSQTPPKEFYRPHLFVNTPDINPPYLQTSGRPGFRIRAVLAATLSGLWGVYSGFELCEAAPLPGREEYLDSEKYELRPRDWNAPGHIIADVTLLNRLRRAHPALQTHLNTRFYVAHSGSILYYGKPSPDGADMILVMVNLDPHSAQECDFEVPLWEFGLPDDGQIAVEDLAAGHHFRWYGKTQHIRLEPAEPYRLWRIGAGQ